MKKFLLVLLIILLPYIMLGQEVIDLTKPAKQPSQDEKKPQMGTSEIVAVKMKSYQDIESLWSHFMDLVERNQWDLAIETLQRIKESKNDLELDILPEISSSLIYVGYNQMRKNSFEYAYQCFLFASEFDPTNLEAYVGIARYYVKKGFIHSFKSIYFLLVSIKGRIATVFSSIQLVIDAAGIIFNMAFYVAVAFSIVIFLKYRILFFHDLHEKYTGTYGKKIIDIIGVVTLMLPLLLFIGWAWIFVFWLMLFWKYGARFEKFIITILVLVLFFWIPFNKFFDEVQKECMDPEIRAYHAGLYEKFNPNTIRSLQSQFGENGKNVRAIIMLAGIWKKAGQLDKAIDLYNLVLKYDGKNIDALNNLGNTYYLLDMQDKAIKNYEQAILQAQNNPTLWYNYSLSVRSQFNFAKAEDLMKKAMALDQNLILSYETRSGNKKSIIDFALTPTDLLKLIYQKTSYHRNPFMIVLLFMNSISIILIVMIVALSILGKKFYYAQKCLSCGVAYCKRCQPIEKRYNYCSQCLHLFVKKDGVSQASKKDKMDYIEKWRRKRYALSYLLSLLAPGSGSLYVESMMTGILAMLVWGFLVALISPGTWTLKPFAISEFRSWLTFGSTVLLVLYYFIYNIIYILKPRKI